MDGGAIDSTWVMGYDKKFADAYLTVSAEINQVNFSIFQICVSWLVSQEIP